jgi:RNA polymerase sigma-70 factor (ECF subfamily)
VADPLARPLDPALVEQIRRRDPGAETTLYERFSARVLYLARRRLGSQDRAEDARAETFLRVFEAIRQGRLRAPEALTSFIVQTANNVIRELARREWRASRLSHELDSVPAPATALRPSVVRVLEDAVAGLGAREREFLRLYYYEDLSAAEIARRLGIKEERVRLVKSRTLQRLRQAYALAVAAG